MTCHRTLYTCVHTWAHSHTRSQSTEAQRPWYQVVIEKTQLKRKCRFSRNIWGNCRRKQLQNLFSWITIIYWLQNDQKRTEKCFHKCRNGCSRCGNDDYKIFPPFISIAVCRLPFVIWRRVLTYMKNMKNKFQEYIAKLVSVGNYYN